MRVAQKICILGAVSLNKIFSLKFVAIQKSLDFFVTPPFLMKQFCDPPAFSCPRPFRKRLIAPLCTNGSAGYLMQLMLTKFLSLLIPFLMKLVFQKIVWNFWKNLTMELLMMMLKIPTGLRSISAILSAQSILDCVLFI